MSFHRFCFLFCIRFQRIKVQTYTAYFSRARQPDWAACHDGAKSEQRVENEDTEDADTLEQLASHLLITDCTHDRKKSGKVSKKYLADEDSANLQIAPPANKSFNIV